MPPKGQQKGNQGGKTNGAPAVQPPAIAQPSFPTPRPLPTPEPVQQQQQQQQQQPRPTSLQSNYDQEPDPKLVAEAVQDMMKNVAALKDAFDSFQGQKTGVSNLPPPTDIATQVRALRRQLISQDNAQETRVNELTHALNNDFTNEVVGRLKFNLERMVREEVTKRIKEKVQYELERQFPKELAEKLILHQKQLKAVKLALHNSEARRANATIRSNHLDEPLTPLEMPNGQVSEVFPKTLANFFTMPEQICQQLLKDYGLPSGDGEPRERVLNRIMAYIGVTFQMVPGPGAAATLSI